MEFGVGCPTYDILAPTLPTMLIFFSFFFFLSLSYTFFFYFLALICVCVWLVSEQVLIFCMVCGYYCWVLTVLQYQFQMPILNQNQILNVLFSSVRFILVYRDEWQRGKGYAGKTV